MTSIKAIILFLVVTFLGAMPTTSYAQEELSDERSRIEPLASRTGLASGTRVGLGVFFDAPLFRMDERYHRSGLGFSLSFNQHIRGVWNGGMQLRWSEHEPREGREPLAPLLIFSRVEAEPLLTLLPVEARHFMRPFAGMGLGYGVFLRNRALFSERAGRRDEAIGSLGAGLRFVWPRAVSVRLSAEAWRGLNTFNHTAMTYQMELLIGDQDGY